MPGEPCTGGWLRADLQAAYSSICLETLPHTHFEAAELGLRSALECSSMVMLLGSTGVGKTRLAHTLAEESNARVSDLPDGRPAVVVKAASPRGRAFSWKSFWMDTLDALADPLPDHKVDRQATAAALQSGRPSSLRHSTEDTLRRSVTCAARDRGLDTLYVDEAASLLKSGSDRVLRDQLDVLRDLADHAAFKVVLISTPSILGSLDASGELLRRIDEVFFRRYCREGPRGRADYTNFRRIVKSLLRRVPKEARLKPTRGQEALLYGGSLGCIGHISKWLRRALIRCDRVQADCLEWQHFEQTCYSDKKLGELYKHAVADDHVIDAWTKRTHCETVCAQTVLAQKSAKVAVPHSGQTPASGSRSRRVGSQRPRRPRVS